MPLMIEMFEAIEGSHIAIVSLTDSWTYASLNEQVNRLAHYLRARGLQKGTSAVLCFKDPIEHLIASLAVLKTGAFFIPLDPKDPLEYRQALIQRTYPCLLLESLPDLTGYSSENLRIPILSRDWAYMIYTSGSTGSPKGVKITHEGFAHRMKHGAAFLGITPQCRVLCQASPAFDMHLAEWGLALSSGATLSPVNIQSRTLSNEMSAMKVTHALVTPGVLRQWNPQDYPDLQCILVGGEVTPQAVIDLWRKQTRVINGYGPTEATIFTHLHEYAETDPARVIGKPLPGITCSIVDEIGNEVPQGAIGELILRGMGIEGGSNGYPTGDLVRNFSNGDYEFISRKEEYLKIRGARVDLHSVEFKIQELFPHLPLVLKGIDEGEKGFVLACFYIGDAELQTSIRTSLRTHLPAYMVPAHFVPLENFPQLTNGKIDRKALVSPLPIKSIRLDSETQRKLSAIWSRILHENPVSLSDDFFAMGGDSLLAVQLMISVEKEWCISLTMEDLFKHSSFGEMVVWIDTAQKVEKKPILIPFKGKGTQSPLLLVHPSIGLIECYRPLAMHMKHDSLYGIQSRFENNATLLLMAETYLKEVVTAFPQGSWILGGWSLGGNIALQMAELLRKERGVLTPVILIDSFAEISPYPIKYEGPVHLIRSAFSPLGDNGWGFLPNRIQSEVSIKHSNMFDRDHIPLMAQRIDEAIAQFACLH